MTIKVKPLVWEYHPAGTMAATGTGLTYIIETRMKGRCYFIKGVYPSPEFDSIEAAKAAAQSDYEARILSAIEAVDPATIRAEALRDMIAAKAREYAEHYPQSSDGRNTFLMFAEWVESLALIDKEQGQ